MIHSLKFFALLKIFAICVHFIHMFPATFFVKTHCPVIFGGHEEITTDTAFCPQAAFQFFHQHFTGALVAEGFFHRQVIDNSATAIESANNGTNYFSDGLGYKEQVRVPLEFLVNLIRVV